MFARFEIDRSGTCRSNFSVSFFISLTKVKILPVNRGGLERVPFNSELTVDNVKWSPLMRICVNCNLFLLSAPFNSVLFIVYLWKVPRLFHNIDSVDVWWLCLRAVSRALNITSIMGQIVQQIDRECLSSLLLPMSRAEKKKRNKWRD